MTLDIPILSPFYLLQGSISKPMITIKLCWDETNSPRPSRMPISRVTCTLNEIFFLNFVLFLVLDSVPFPYYLCAKYSFPLDDEPHTWWRAQGEGLTCSPSHSIWMERGLRGVLKREENERLLRHFAVPQPHRDPLPMLSLSWCREIFLSAHSRPCVVAYGLWTEAPYNKCVLFLGGKGRRAHNS